MLKEFWQAADGTSGRVGDKEHHVDVVVVVVVGGGGGMGGVGGGWVGVGGIGMAYMERLRPACVFCLFD